MLTKHLQMQFLLSSFIDVPGDLQWDKSNLKDSFNYAVDLVRHIKKTFGDHFTICVAGVSFCSIDVGPCGNV